VSARSDADPVAAKEGGRAAEEARGGRAFLVGERFEVGEPGRVVDRDVDEASSYRGSSTSRTVQGSVQNAAASPCKKTKGPRLRAFAE
jgi:hypothetical protein